MEIRLHGRGGQGGVTCAKILAAVYARLGKSVQAFGDYAGERSGAPVRAYARVSDGAITNRNKVYQPDHLLVLDPSLLSSVAVAGLVPGGTLLVNTPSAPDELAEAYGAFRIATVDATKIARQHGIGTRSVVIVNTTIAGAFAKLMDVPLQALEEAYEQLGLGSNVAAARDAYDAVVSRVADPTTGEVQEDSLASGPWAAAGGGARPPVLDLLEHVVGPPPAIKTGSWRSQLPRYKQGLAPCNAACPAGNDVVGFVQALARGDEHEAAAILSRSTPLPAVCGRVCPAFCMSQCNRIQHDGAVNVRALERYVADEIGLPAPARATIDDPKRIAIVGGGPAGLAAAFELAQAGHEPTIFETESELGGVLRTGIPKFRLPPEVVEREIQRIVDLGVEVRTDATIRADRLVELEAEYDGVIIAAGLQWLRGLRVPGADLAGVEQGIRFLHRVNFGGAQKVTGHVVVLGGGNTAMDCARTALRLGADHVTVAYRRTRQEMPAIADEIEEALAEGVEMLFQRSPLGFSGDGKVEAIELAEVEMGPPDESGRRRPVVTDRKRTLPCDMVLLALGQGVEDELFPEGWELDQGRMWKQGEPLMVFGAGDVSTNEGTVTHAVGDGRRVAGLLLKALGHEVEVFARPDGQAVAAEGIRMDHFPHAEPHQQAHEGAETRVEAFDEVVHGLADASEAERCLACGYCTRCDTCLMYCPEGRIARVEAGYDIDMDYCKGCGICVAECPRCGMEMVAE
ncbi:MAG: FAD-dependent oxidoreductase [Deltaproteobacteria bacterium]|jgi:2-oxoacid:acceptor oxidoreductase gamma subunit (pyruvate/2-ketoisovalerate family)|nr:FAD-dependent oxidoreductase [Deltaproteobacteria bacterium]MBW2533780.1 FAD-dependent oxidoreductase [Deltaproteobacteria bacterium]